MYFLIGFFAFYLALSVLGVWFKTYNVLDKFFPKIPKFTPFFGFDEGGNGYYPVVFQRGLFYRRRYFELKEALFNDPDSAVCEAKALIDQVIIPLHKNPIPKYPPKSPPK